MTVIDSTPRNPQNTDAQVGDHTGSIMNYPGGTLTINEVTPLAGRTNGDSPSNIYKDVSSN